MKLIDIESERKAAIDVYKEGLVERLDQHKYPNPYDTKECEQYTPRCFNAGIDKAISIIKENNNE